MEAYLDNSATTRVCPEAAQAVIYAMTQGFGNPSSTHRLGREAKEMLDRARKNVADAIGASAQEIFFTSGGTEGDNWAIRSGAELKRHEGRHVISTTVEHDAVLNSLKRLEKDGYEVTLIPPEKNGRMDMEAFKAALRPDTTLVSAMLVNNETGAVNDIAAIKAIMKKAAPNALLHTDAVQGLFKVPFTAKSLGADMITMSSHKIHGPKGVGALYIRKGLRLPPLIFGGGQESAYRSGTEALPNICGFGEAAKIGKELAAQSMENMRAMRTRAAELISGTIPGAEIIGEGDAPHVLSISLPGYRSEVILNWLDREGICVSNSSACKRGGRSHVLEAMGLSPREIDGAIRVSFSRLNTMEETEYFAAKLKEATERLIKTK